MDKNDALREEAINNLKEMKFATEENVYPDKYCLFWMARFPRLLHSAWKTMTADNDFTTYFQDFFPKLVSSPL